VRLATFSHDGGTSRVGALADAETIVDLGEVDPRPPFRDMQSFIEAGTSAHEEAAHALERAGDGARLALADVTLHPPLDPPAQLRDCLAFEEHLRNSFAQAAKLTGEAPRPIPDVWYEQPIYYKANRFSVAGHEADVVWPPWSQVIDYELEVACVIGRGGRDIAAADAPGHVFGYTIFNDASARDAQLKEMAGQLGPAKGKDFDTGNVLGPWIVTVDELGDPQDLEMVARVNGEEWSRGSTAAMHHSFADIIAFVSRSETLHPGEVIGSGTVGTGCGLEQGRFLSEGDVVELEVARIGVLRNRFVRS
jgi:2-keto-4-pentenoate hydratase/2-oxohepta-3-ene-1,7-dioic acid hydratase in catechol pathway